MDAGIGQQLVEVAEPADVTDLGDERGRDHRTDSRDRPQAMCDLAVKQLGDASVGGLDLALEQIELVEQQADLEGHLGIQLGHRDRLGGGRLEPLGLRLAESSVTGSRVWRWPAWSSGAGRPDARLARCPAPPGPSGRSGPRRAPPSSGKPSSGKPSSTRRMRRWQTFACSVTRVMAKRAAWRSSTPTSGSRAGGVSRMAISARLRASAGSDLVRARRLLAKYFAMSGLTTATGTSRRRRCAASGIQ